MDKVIITKIRQDSFICGGALGALIASCMPFPFGFLVAGGFIAWGYVKYTDPKAKAVVDQAEAEAKAKSATSETPVTTAEPEKAEAAPAQVEQATPVETPKQDEVADSTK